MTTETKQQQSGGSAANPNNKQTNNPQPQMNQQKEPDKQTDEHLTLKEAAARFQCAASSLKQNVKMGRITALHESPKAPYLVNATEVESFLRSRPAIASLFHPKNAEAGTTGGSGDPSVDDPQAIRKQSKGDRETPSAEIRSAESPLLTEPAPLLTEPAESANQLQEARTMSPTQKRRHRHLRHRGTKLDNERRTTEQNATGFSRLKFKSLAGTSAQERLRIVACLNEIAGLVARG